MIASKRDQRGIASIAALAGLILLLGFSIVAMESSKSNMSTSRNVVQEIAARDAAQSGVDTIAHSLSASGVDLSCTTSAVTATSDAAQNALTRSGWAGSYDPATRTITTLAVRYASLKAAALTANQPAVSGAGTTGPWLYDSTNSNAFVGKRGGNPGLLGYSKRVYTAKIAGLLVASKAGNTSTPVYGVPATSKTLGCDGKPLGGLWEDTFSATSSINLGTVATSSAYTVGSYDAMVSGASSASTVNVYATNDSNRVTGANVVRSTASATFDYNDAKTMFAAGADSSNASQQTCVSTAYGRGYKATGTLQATTSLATAFCVIGSTAVPSVIAPATGTAVIFIYGDADLSNTTISANGTGTVQFYVTGNVTLGPAEASTFIYAPNGTCKAAPAAINFKGALACKSIDFTGKTVTAQRATPPVNPLSPQADQTVIAIGALTEVK